MVKSNENTLQLTPSAWRSSTHTQTQPTLRPGSYPVQPQPQLGVQFSKRQEHLIHFHCPHLCWLSQFSRRDDLQMLKSHICSCSSSSMLLLIFISVLLWVEMSITVVVVTDLLSWKWIMWKVGWSVQLTTTESDMWGSEVCFSEPFIWCFNIKLQMMNEEVWHRTALTVAGVKLATFQL